jgi:hypothetical protein
MIGVHALVPAFNEAAMTAVNGLSQHVAAVCVYDRFLERL